MDRLDYLNHAELLLFFHYKKTLMSCMEKPHTFLSQLRDHDLIPEDRYKTASLTGSRDKLRKALYDILDQFEKERPQDIRAFWKCVFNDIIMDQYPTLRALHDSLMDGSFHFNKPTGATVRKESADGKKRKGLPEDEGANPGNETKRQRSGSADEEQPGPSSQPTPGSALKTGHKSDVWDAPIFNLQLPVTCGDLEGTLIKERLAKGEKCILFQRQWFTPSEFEKRAGRQSSRNWKLSIRCNGTPLGRLIQEGHLVSVKYKGGFKKDDKFLRLSDQAGADEDETEQQQEAEHDSSCTVFKVTCSDIRFEAAAESGPLSPAESKVDVKLEETPPSDFRPISNVDDERRALEEDEQEKSRRGESLWGSGEEQPGPSSPSSPSSRLTSASFVRMGERDVGFHYRPQLPVTCGDLEGTLSKARLAQGEKCILFQRQWFTPSEFEKRAGRQSSKNWKLSIRWNGTPLGRLIQEGLLASGKYKGGCKKDNKLLRVSDQAGAGQQELEDPDGSNGVFSVTCGAKAGTLHKKRFASGSCGMSIRTETRWMTPEEFVSEAMCGADASWEKDIAWNGEPLGVLVERSVLRMHSASCECENCRPDQKHLEDQQNDDECCVCRGDEPELVVCEKCPRSFHQRCHLPHVEDAELRDERPWMCTFCEFSHYSSSERLEMPAAMSQYISRHTLKCQYLLLYLCCADEERTLACNPTGETFSTVRQPAVSISNVANKLRGREYQTVQEFVSDVQLVLTGRAANHQDGAAESRRLQDAFDGALKKVFNIR